MVSRLQLAQIPSKHMLELGQPDGEHRPSKSLIQTVRHLEPTMTAQHGSVLEKFVAEAIRLGAEQLEVEYKDGYEELSAIAGDFGFGIGRLRSTCHEAAELRQELYQCARRKRQIVVDGDNYELHARTYD